jgi:hypothetical protein
MNVKDRHRTRNRLLGTIRSSNPPPTRTPPNCLVRNNDWVNAHRDEI